MGDFNARYPALGDLPHTPHRNGTRLVEYIRRYRLSLLDTSDPTHSWGGTLDHILTFLPVASHIKCSSIPALFSDHIALALHYSLPVTSPRRSRTHINIPPKYCPTCVSYMSSLLPTFV